MCCKSFTKRILPFFLTFAVGLFIASFFVSIAAPSFQFPNRGSRKKHREYDRQRDIEIKQLREENQRLRSDTENTVNNFSATYKMNEDGTLKSVEKVEINGVPVDTLVPPPTLNTISRQGR